MKWATAKGGVALALLLTLGNLQGCFGLQRAWGCNNPGIFGCKGQAAEPSDIERPPTNLERASPSGRGQREPLDDARYLAGHEHPWSRLLDDCMDAGGTRTECFASLPPDILEQFEAWEAEQAAERRRLLQRR